jgi:hypothetical protein
MDEKPSAVFAAWDRSLFVDSKLSSRIKAIIDAGRGGNYGLTAPRGAGKSWLLQQAVYWATHDDRSSGGKTGDGPDGSASVREKGLGILFPSPSQGEPEDFLVALSEVVAQSYIDYYIAQRRLSSTPEGLRQTRQLIMLFFVALCGGAALLALGLIAPYFFTLNSGLSRAGVFIILGSGVVFLILATRSRGKPQGVYEIAVDFRRQARFAAVFNKSTGFSGSLSQLGASIGLTTSQGANFTERPVTLSSLVYGFREFCSQVVRALDEAPMVIAIDELDKIEDTASVLKLLRGIKGIFDIQGVHYFVSISDEAARRLELGGIRERNEFNSSFYQVYQLPRIGFGEVCALLERRKIKIGEAEIAAITVLSGGIPREVIRLTDILVNSGTLSAAEQPCPELAILAAEATAFRVETETDESEGITEDDRVWVGYALSENIRSRSSFSNSDFYRWWYMSNTSDAFQKRYQEDFRRLLNRLTVGRNLISAPQARLKDAVRELQPVVVANERGSGVGFTALRDIDKDLDLLGIGETHVKAGTGVPEVPAEAP